MKMKPQSIEEIEAEWDRINRIPLNNTGETHELLLEKEQRQEIIKFAQRYVGKLIYMIKTKPENPDHGNSA